MRPTAIVSRDGMRHNTERLDWRYESGITKDSMNSVRMNPLLVLPIVACSMKSRRISANCQLMIS